MLKFVPLLGLLMLTTVSCATTDTPKSEDVQLTAAEAGIDPSTIDPAREAPGRELLQRQLAAEKQALQEIEERLVYPRTYGQTVVISRDNAPFRIPPGPMEELVNQKVTMQLRNAGVQDLIMALSQFDGLNFIADDALEAEKTLTINAQEVPLHELLTYIARNMGIAFHIGENTIWITESDDTSGSGTEMETRIFRLHNGLIPSMDGEGEDEELYEALQELLADSPMGSVLRIFKHRNILLLRNTRANLRAAEETIFEFDKAPAQVLIEARYLTISHQNLLELGTDIQRMQVTRDDGVKAEITNLLASSTFAGFGDASSGFNLSMSGILGNHEYQVLLHLLEKEGRARTLSAPRVTVLNNRTAEIRRGDKLYYFEEFDIESSGGENPISRIVPTGSPTELELGITLRVQVNVGNDGRQILLALEPEIKEFLGWEDFLTNQIDDGDNDDAEIRGGLVRLPRVNENTLKTTAVVASTETVVLGGMLTTTKQESVSKIPVLGDIPWLGALFRHQADESSPQHLIIFVTATLVSPNGQYVNVQPLNDN